MGRRVKINGSGAYVILAAMTDFSARPIAPAAIAADGLRPVNLRTDLRQLANLIELVFSDSMDSSGHSAIREMRYLSHIGYGLNLVARLNELALGISLGFVYQKAGDLVGNVSIYPADYPKDMGDVWILANVAVHPNHQRRGIASRLVDASLDMIRRRGGKRVILQVNYDNEMALRLYERRGFRYERAWQIWRRSGFMGAPAIDAGSYRASRLGSGDWRAEYELAEAARPNALGGLGWLKPLHIDDFRIPLRRRLVNLFSLNSLEKHVIRDAGDSILASCWQESAVGGGGARLRFFGAPMADQEALASALIGAIVARQPASSITIEHPRDETATIKVLKRLHFKLQRELWHMRLDL